MSTLVSQSKGSVHASSQWTILATDAKQPDRAQAGERSRILDDILYQYHSAGLSLSFQCEVIIVVRAVFRSCINALSASGPFLYQTSKSLSPKPILASHAPAGAWTRIDSALSDDGIIS